MQDKVLYLECTSGISGDMTVAALLDLGADRQVLTKALESLPLSGYSIQIKEVFKSGIRACDFDVILKKETIDLMSTNRLTPAQEATYTLGGAGSGYGLGVRTPNKDLSRSEFGWGGAAGAYCSVDRKNGLSIYYAQHVLTAPNRALRGWLYKTVLGDLNGQTVEVPIPKEPEDHTITY